MALMMRAFRNAIVIALCILAYCATSSSSEEYEWTTGILADSTAIDQEWASAITADSVETDHVSPTFTQAYMNEIDQRWGNAFNADSVEADQRWENAFNADSVEADHVSPTFTQALLNEIDQEWENVFTADSVDTDQDWENTFTSDSVQTDHISPTFTQAYMNEIDHVSPTFTQAYINEIDHVWTTTGPVDSTASDQEWTTTTTAVSTASESKKKKKTGPYMLNGKNNCYWDCGGGPCPKICGSGGYCCRRGYGGCPTYMNDVAPDDHHTCIQYRKGAGNKRRNQQEADKICKDKSGFCGYWAATGWCEKNPPFMAQRCRKSCKFCNDVICGRHLASSCEECTWGYGRSRCKGECSWCYGKCQAKEKACIRPSPVNGNWGTWGEWGGCMKVDNEWLQKRNRLCDNPAPKYDGEQCVGSQSQNRTCTTGKCKPDGFLCGDYCASSCSQCIWEQMGWQYQYRGARGCEGECFWCNGKCQSKEKKCAVRWGHWDHCTKTCGGGTQTRWRDCGNNIHPKYGGKCYQTQKCNTQKCPHKDVNCGNHQAPTCEQCRVINGQYDYSLCHRGCKWCNGKCQAKGKQCKGFSLAPTNLNSCPLGSHLVKDLHKCKNTVKNIYGIKFEGAGCRYISKGCVYHWRRNSIIFNTCKSGKPWDYYNMFCEQDAVNCGLHSASSCRKCGGGKNSLWCKGECSWCNGKCQAKQKQCKEDKTPKGVMNRLNAEDGKCLDYANELRKWHLAPNLSLDPYLTKKAQMWAENLADNDFFAHDHLNNRLDGNGENIFMVGNYVSDKIHMSQKRKYCKQAVKAWYDEINFYDFKTGGRKAKYKNSMIGHFTQMVWNATIKVGFGVVTSEGFNEDGLAKIYVVAKFLPPGNYVGANLKFVTPKISKSEYVKIYGNMTDTE